MTRLLRQAWLTARVKLRAIGWTPWLLFLAWVSFAASLEPPVLRASGVRLREAATWTSAAVLWILLAATSNRELPRRLGPRLTAHLILLLCVAAASVLLALVFGFKLGTSHSRLSAIEGGLWFMMAWAPLAIAPQKSTQTITSQAITAILAVPSAVWMVSLWLAPVGFAALTATTGLSLGAGVLSMLARNPEGDGRPDRKRA